MTYMRVEFPPPSAAAALAALGEAIATVARARMICTLMAQQSVSSTGDDESVGYSLNFWRGVTVLACEIELVKYTADNCGRGEKIAEWIGHPVDIAADAVACLIAEATR